MEEAVDDTAGDHETRIDGSFRGGTMRWDQTSCQRKKGRTVNDGEGTVVGFRINDDHFTTTVPSLSLFTSFQFATVTVQGPQ